MQHETLIVGLSSGLIGTVLTSIIFLATRRTDQQRQEREQFELKQRQERELFETRLYERLDRIERDLNKLGRIVSGVQGVLKAWVKDKMGEEEED